MKKIFPFLLMLLVIASCGKDDDDNNNNDNKLSTPLLLVPANNSAVATTQFDSSVEFEWTEIANATQYLLEVSDNANFSNILLSTTRQSNSAYPYFGANGVVFESGTYYWRVRATGPGFDPSDYSDVYSFNFTKHTGGGGGGGNDCDFCGRQYDGIFNANFIEDGFTYNYENRPMDVNYIFQNGNLHLSMHDFYFPTTHEIDIVGELNGTVITYTNKVWNFPLYNISLIINGTATFDNTFTSVTGEFTLSGTYVGTLDFFATL